MIGNITLEKVKEQIYVNQTISANPAHNTEIKRRIRLDWRNEKQHSILFEEKSIIVVCHSSINIRLGNLTYHKRSREKTEKSKEIFFVQYG